MNTRFDRKPRYSIVITLVKIIIFFIFFVILSIILLYQINTGEWRNYPSPVKGNSLYLLTVLLTQYVHVMQVV